MGKIIAIDVGNSNIVVAAIEDGHTHFVERFKTHYNWKRNKILDTLKNILVAHELKSSDIEGSVISSVVPVMNPLLIQAIRVLTGQPPLLVCPTMKSQFLVRDYDTSCLGMDRVADMTAAKEYYPTPLMVVDLGTCTTISVVDKQGYFVGGLICAGIQLSLDAQAECTAQLPALKADDPTTLIGNDTVSNMLSGAVIGTATMIDGLAMRVRSELSLANDEQLSVVLTGGLSSRVLPWLTTKVYHEPELLLKGLEIIYRKNA